MKANFKNIIILLLIIGIVIVGASFLMNKSGNEDKFVYSDLVDLFEKDLAAFMNLRYNTVDHTAVEPGFEAFQNQTVDTTDGSATGTGV